MIADYYDDMKNLKLEFFYFFIVLIKRL